MSENDVDPVMEPSTVDGDPGGRRPGWRRFGRILIEREALLARLPAGGEGVLTASEIGNLLYPGEPRVGGPARDAVIEAFEAGLEGARQALAAELERDTPIAAVTLNAQLSDTELAVLCVCAAADIDDETARLGAAAQALRAPAAITAGLVQRMLGDNGLAALQPGGRLQRAGLLELEDTGPLASARISISRRLIAVLLDDLSLDPVLPPDAGVVFAPLGATGTEDLVLVCAADRVRALQAAVIATRGDGSLVTTPPTDASVWRVLVAQATVLGVGIVLELATPTEGSTARLPSSAKYWIGRADHLSWAVSAREPLVLDSMPSRPWAEVAAAAAEVTDDEWATVFGGAPEAGRRPTADQLRAVSGVARTADGPDEAFRRLASGSLHGTATRVVPRATWADLILAPAHEARLRELIARYRHRSTMHEQWGLPLYPSPGLVALFSGPSGTGKTTAAEVLAAELGVEMFRVDLSALVSKYIGETEKNLEQIFSAAHAGNYLLLFDEADSLFGSRSKVTDSKDRYANMEVSYLLQRLETYDGFVVLTSNFQGNIDQAFLRRMHASVHFPVPDAADRKRIWIRSLAQAPTRDLDLDLIADKFDLAGGGIRNAALGAAFLAAAGSGVVDMGHVMRSIAQELGKLGRRAPADMSGP